MIPLDESILRERCADCNHVGRLIHVVAEAASTNDLCHEAASNRENAGLAIFAERQTAGRGQQGRSWTAPAGSSLLFSILLNPPDAMALPHFLTAWSAVAVAEQLRADFGVDVRIKWPNDLLVNGRKLCGILVERRHGTVVGIGLNVSIRADEFPADVRLPATSLALETFGPIDRTELAARLLGRLDQLYGVALMSGPQAIWERWTPLAENLGDGPIVAVARRTEIVGRLLDLRPDVGARVLREDGSVARIPPEELVRIERPEKQ